MAYHTPTGNISETVCPLWTRSPRKPGYEMMGSSVLCAIGPKTFLISAAHVLDQSQNGSLFVGTPRGFLRLTDTATVTALPEGGRESDRQDVGFICLNPEAMKLISASYSVLPASWLTVEDRDTAETPFRLFGCPWRKVRKMANTFTPELTDLRLMSHPREKYSELCIDPERHIALEFPREHMLTPDKRPVTAPEMDGMSGSPVWKFVRTERSGQPAWTFRLAGILIGYKRPQKTLIATRIIVPLEGIRLRYPELSGLIPKNYEIQTICRNIGPPQL